ncbi:DNA primase [Nitrosomonas sp. Nm51]|uniref:DNA primase n=1 Tax=Nitrosomonas sp. Nm51 TaxID=133720 RepID=UPI0008AE49DC|nr:DNA primase [Nitrosomonas sp. Nm51]SEQ86727.1 DNA primase [Nitrosomonas sp. Nm51]
MIPESFIHDLLARVNIIDAVDRHVSLKKAGANYVACCPFHTEKTPSFTVSAVKQFYHCFGCGAHGDAINFLMEYRGIGFVEAVKELAFSVGLQVPEPQSDVSTGRSNTAHNEDRDTDCVLHDLLEIIRAATQFYRKQLKQSEKAVDYLKQRGVSGETAARFGLGYAPDDWHSLSALFADYRTEKTRKKLVHAGLAVSGEDGKQYDRFRDRIMFPILNQKGQIIAFGGRIVGQGEPKYLNSPETDLFVKGQEVYNLFLARRAIRDAGYVIVVEGYMDVVALSQYDIDNAVATLGTAITSVHIQKLLRQSDKIVFCFDGDNAGKKAAWRALENSLDQLTDSKTIHFLFLPEGEDPDSFVRKNGKDAFEQHVAQAVPLSEFLLHTLSCGQSLQTSESRARLIHDVKPMLQRIKAPALMLMLLKRLSELSALDQNELATLLQIKQTASVRVPAKTARKQPASPCRWLLLLLLYNPKFFRNLENETLVLDNDTNEELAALKYLVEFFNGHPDIVDNAQAMSILSFLQDNPYRVLLEKIESEILEWDDAMDLEAEFAGAVKKLQEMQRKKRMKELHNKPLNLLTDAEKRELQRLAMH